MPTGEQRCMVATQELPYHVIWRLGENDLVERTRRSMKTEHVLPGFQRDVESRAKLLDKGDIAFRELRERPGPDLSLIPARLFTCRRLLARDQFFFQAEDGIRDHCVTGVQTCALPI